MLRVGRMKVDPKAQLAQVAVTAKAQPFKQLLAEARSELKKEPAVAAARPLVKTAVSTISASAKAHTQTLLYGRTQANSETQRLGVARAEALEVTRALTQVRAERNEVVEERGAARMLEFIAKEFTPDPQARLDTLPPLASVHHLHPAAQVAPKLDAPPEAKAAQAVALIERIETFVKSQRPGLALTLNNSLGAHVEIERIGPKEIALKLVGHRGPPTAEAVSRIRDELQARGLKVAALSVA